MYLPIAVCVILQASAALEKFNNSAAAIKYFILGFRNAFTPIQVKMTKNLGQISSEIFEKRRVLIEQEKDRRKTSANKK